MEALLACEEPGGDPSNFRCEDENPVSQSDAETISTKEEAAEGILASADNAHPNIHGQHKGRKQSLGPEDEFLGQCESEDGRDKPRRSTRP